MTSDNDEFGPAMLTGLMGVGDSMFNAMGEPDKYKLAPNPEDMRAAADQAQYTRRADLKYIEARTYDLSEEDEQVQYCKDREWILTGMSMNTHYLFHHEKKFVAEMNPPRWIAHMEWAEFVLTEKVVPTIKSTEES